MSRSSKRDERTRVSTRLKLATALRQAGAPPAMVSAAERGIYDPIHSPVMDPLAALIHDARMEKLENIVGRALSGEWREQAWEREEWLNNPEIANEARQWNAFVLSMHGDQKGGMVH